VIRPAVESGATALRAAAALGWPISSIKGNAYDLGIQLPGAREIRVDLRDEGAIEDR
jgi:hypothetical protein